MKPFTHYRVCGILFKLGLSVFAGFAKFGKGGRAFDRIAVRLELGKSMGKRLCKICWEMVEENGPCNAKVKCDKDFGNGGTTTSDKDIGVGPDVLPAGAWTGSSATWEIVSDIGSGFKKVYAKCILSLEKSYDLPGTDFQMVCPMQDHVNPKIVAAKVEAFKNKAPDKNPVVPVVYNKSTGHVTINGDGHHTFVACLKAQVPVCLYLYKVPFAGQHKDWRTCSYKEFSLNPAGATGTKFT